MEMECGMERGIEWKCNVEWNMEWNGMWNGIWNNHVVVAHAYKVTACSHIVKKQASCGLNPSESYLYQLKKCLVLLLFRLTTIKES